MNRSLNSNLDLENEGSPPLELVDTLAEENCCLKNSNLNPNCNIFIPLCHQGQHESNLPESLSCPTQIRVQGADISHDAYTLNPLAENFDPPSQCDNNCNTSTESSDILNTTPIIADLNTPDISFDSENVSNGIFDFPEDILLPVVRKIVSHARGFAPFNSNTNNHYFHLCVFCYFIYILSLRLVFDIVLGPNCEEEFLDFSKISFLRFVNFFYF